MTLRRLAITGPPPIRWAPALAAACLLITAFGCSSLSHRHVTLTSPAAPGEADGGADGAGTAEDRQRVLLLVVDGLRRGVLAEHLAALDEADDQPDWASGLALLRRQGFRFATADRAEAPVPGGGIAAAATWATGRWPADHRIPGAAFYEARPDGRLLRYAFDAPLDGTRIHYGPNLAEPTADANALPSTLLGAETWASKLPADRRIGFVFSPFGHQGEWLIPSPPDVGAAGALRTAYGAAATPLFDRESADGMLELLLDPDVDVVVASFRGVGVDSCVQPAAACGGAEGGLNAIQRRALTALDGRLADALGRYLIARPDAFRRTSVLLVGTGSGVDRGAGQPDGAKSMPPSTLLERVIERAKDAPCRERLMQARARNALAVIGHGAVARIYVKPAPLGQQHRIRGDLACIGPAVDALLADTSWLAAIARRPATAVGAPGPRSARFEVKLRDGFEKGLSARRRSRLMTRIRQSIDDGPAPRSGDVVLFASNGWVFSEPGAPGLPSDAALGSLEAASMAVPFLIADPGLSDVAQGALRASAVELADVGPTVLAMLGADPEQVAALPRPPVVRWRAEPRVLEVVAADRRINRPKAAGGPSTAVIETDTGLTVELSESTDLWPADELALRIGEQVWRWDPDASTFPEGAPCTYAEADERRVWRCTAEFDREQPIIDVVAARRMPSGDDDIDGPLVEMRPVVRGRVFPRIERIAATCRTPESLRLAVTADDALGLALLDVFVVDDRIGGPNAVPGGLLAETALGGVERAEPCAADPLAPACTLSATAPRVDGPVDVPLPARFLDHHATVRGLPGVARVDGAALAERWSKAGPRGTAPRRAWLEARVCNITGRCTRQPLVSDVDYAALPICP